MKRVLLYSIFLLVISCAGREAKENNQPVSAISHLDSVPVKSGFEKSKVISSVVSSLNASIGYALYLPHQYSDTAHLPVLIFLDPHGDGSLPLTKYQKLAEEFGVILMASNDSKNGMTFEQTTDIVKTLMEEAKQQFKVTAQRISLCGFSGGAKVALMASMNMTGLQNVIYCGAGLPPQQIMENPATIPPALGFAGIRDLNYTEVIQTDEALDQKKIPHCLIEWKGKHEWVDSISFADAFYWMEFRSGRKEHLEEFIAKNKAEQKEPLAEWRRLKKMIAFLNGVGDVSKYILAHEAIIKRKDFQLAVQKQTAELQEESNRKQEYVRFIDEKDLSWWKTESDRMKNVKGEKETTNQRLLAYISLACYSLGNAAIKQGDKEGAERILAVYKMVDPENADKSNLESSLKTMMPGH